MYAPLRAVLSLACGAANQGPLLGIFITGPLGFVLGGIGGAVYWFRRRGRGAGE